MNSHRTFFLHTKLMQQIPKVNAKGQKLCKTIIVFLHFYDLKFYCTLRVLTQTDRVGGDLLGWERRKEEKLLNLFTVSNT